MARDHSPRAQTHRLTGPGRLEGPYSHVLFNAMHDSHLAVGSSRMHLTLRILQRLHDGGRFLALPPALDVDAAVEVDAVMDEEGAWEGW